LITNLINENKIEIGIGNNKISHIHHQE